MENQKKIKKWKTTEKHKTKKHTKNYLYNQSHTISQRKRATQKIKF